MENKEEIIYGNQNPRYRICREYENTYGDACIDFMRDLDIELFPWEQNWIRDCLAIDSNGEFINMINGLSVPRRNGKTLCIIALCIFFMCIYPEIAGQNRYAVLYSAHNVDTNTETNNELIKFFDDEDTYPELYKLTHWGGTRTSGIRRSNGKEAILCKWESDGVKYESKVSFNARSKNSARGKGTNVIIFDEAQELTSEQTESILPTAGSSKTKQLIFYTGTPIYPSCPGTSFRDLRKRAINKKPRGVSWWEWSVSEIGDVYDKQRWIDTNPSLGYILSIDWIETAELNMSEDGFARERLGFWPDNRAIVDYPIDRECWENCAISSPSKKGLKCYGVKFDLGGRNCALTIAVKNDGIFHLELIDVFSTRNGLDNIVDALTKVSKNASQIIIDGRGFSYDLQQRLLNNKVAKSCIMITKTEELVNSCTMIANAVESGEITHFSQEQLNSAAINCTRRIIGNKGAWGFEDNESENAYSFIIESAALAYYACRTTKRNPHRKGWIY